MTGPPDMTPLRRARRAKAVAAAERVFLDRGFRAATMEAIAAEAGISKATLYGYLPDKDAAFLAVAEAMRDGLRTAALAALETGGPAHRRIADGLITKHAAVARTVRASPHARELFAAKDRRAAHLFEALDDELMAGMARLLVAEGAAAAAAADVARLIFAAAQGVADAADGVDELERDLARLVRALLGAR